VFAVQRPDDERVFALKRLENPARLERFEREIAAMQELASEAPQIVPPILEAGVDSKDRAYYVMPFYERDSLEDVVRAGGYRHDLIAGLDVLLDVADALERAHARNWAHRDLKPANILLDDDNGRPLLGDFGLALLADVDGPRVTEQEEAVGSRATRTQVGVLLIGGSRLPHRW
jgi:serine/threonine protein kinase